MKSKREIYTILFFVILKLGLTQVNPIGSYYCKMYQMVGSTLVYQCPGKLSITVSPFNSSFLSSSDTSCTGYCSYCCNQLSFNVGDSTLSEPLNNYGGKIFPGDSIFFKQRQIGSFPSTNYYMGHKMQGSSIGVHDIESINDWVLFYPNPTREKIYIQNISKNVVSEVQLIDQSGNVQLNAEVTGSFIELNLEQLHSGIYFLELHFRDAIIVRKVIINP